MPRTTLDYRSRVYRDRAHPEEGEDGVDDRDSLTRVYLSAIPFLGAEYFVETVSTGIPAGLVFPLGYLLFWGFYYTFYSKQPFFLEDHLSSPRLWNPLEIAGVFLGVGIWFVKATLHEFLLFGRWIRTRRRALNRPPPQVAIIGMPRPRRSSGLVETLPSELKESLSELGLGQTAAWDDIHHRYRELAKRYHPDLNPEVTSGTRFVRVDAAYRRLNAARFRYFSGKR